MSAVPLTDEVPASRSEYTRAVLALGSNLGARAETLAEAISDLVDRPEVRLVDVSPVVQTKAVGGPEGQPDFLNMVVIVQTSLGPYELLAHCHAVEAKHHRTREVRWGPRTLDIDIITYNTLSQDDPVLTLPHPRAAERAFVLYPWLLIDPTAVLEGHPIVELLEDCADADGVEGYDLLDEGQP
ncbi:2-amino-4-hydroxy-6-hydroxymethyldihydropteridine diphosphokinase [Sinomonas sp. JGH33]|uniref:2-amino-4-hydroxy-6-hydroxymethyldihydropteridine diphosphokinase n=1 Tax=Sinomonas terricola TaxID=3110330 RepID=A0ABU5T532_9MICC|nr:2-amino-4-hydroxy-6-hydroxymethyldihydropteridine diphosphokinase [Sinomonas sp. JGH33]MEA5454785.1 2-amino-4-hydroxy-6-hydroxymethyldihydropteridine diphosphokinase [Sinomonas sp. JGH33]